MIGDNRPVVVVQWTEDGELHRSTFGEGCRLLVIEERVPHDRVYEMTHRFPLSALEQLVPADAAIGHAGDCRQAWLLAQFEGRPHLQLVPSEGA